MITRYFIIWTYVGCATIGIFAYWYLFFQHADWHSLITYKQLSSWTQCESWTDFHPASFSWIDLSTKPCQYFFAGKKKPVTLALTVLVVIEMFNAMNAISDESSLLTVTIFENPYLIVAIFCSITTHCMILYVPFFNDVFGIMPLDLSEWTLVIIFSFPVVLIDECIKFVVRNCVSKRWTHSIEHKQKLN